MSNVITKHDVPLVVRNLMEGLVQENLLEAIEVYMLGMVHGTNYKALVEHIEGFLVKHNMNHTIQMGNMAACISDCHEALEEIEEEDEHSIPVQVKRNVH